ncbi:MAG: hypothetical protein M1829_006393 [Trizodia sp. TS-e1964]|nr:MAG: hypothetical protein M1829_006393 [Trizodia sp. TS-e1964]
MAPTIQISIPNTSLSSSAKPFTLYNVTLRLPLRSYIIQKRYSDFIALHDSLVSLTGSVPPAQLPEKSWFKRTISNPALTEERRRGLEAYLQTINESEDVTWRSTGIWRSFLNLPSNTTSANSSSAAALRGSLTAPGIGGASITDPTVWLDCHRDVKTQLRDARLHIQRRDQATTAQSQHESAAASKRCLVQAGAMITALADGLKAMSEAKDAYGSEKLGEGELRRRRDLVSSVRKEKEGLEALSNSLNMKTLGNGSLVMNSGAAATDQDKSALFAASNPPQNPSSRAGRVLGAPLPETERTRELDNEGVLKLQRQMMQDQDMDVEVLRKIIARQRDMGEAINGELILQNDMLRQVDDDTSRLGSKVDVAARRVKKIS